MATTNESPRGGLRGLSDRYPRLLFLPFGVLLGAIGAVGFLRNGDSGMAVFMLVLMTLFGTFVAFSKSEYVLASTGTGDERHQTLDLLAARFAFMVTGLFALGGAGWEIFSRRADGPASNAFALVCFVGTASYAGAFLFLRRRR